MKINTSVWRGLQPVLLLGLLLSVAVAQLDERKEYFQRSIVLIDSRDGTVYPLPIDAFSGPLVGKDGARTYGTVETSVESDTFCVSGALLVYRAFEEGRFCFGFDGVRFTGHTTQYMQ